MSARSYLYVPGDQPDKLERAAKAGADAIIADLEDAVAQPNKERARGSVRAWLASNQGEQDHWVRVNAHTELTEDAAALKGLPLAGVVVPKVSSPKDIEQAARVFGDLPFCALIETAAGVLDARAIAEHPKVVRLALGEADLSAELGATVSDNGREMLAVRTMIVLASAAAGLEQPTAPVSTDFRDLDGFRRSTEALKRMGFGARPAIHPAQVPLINDVFTPTAEEVAAARRLLELFEAAGGRVTVDDKGRMVDEALVRAARSTLARADG